jgi:hypothetical protein
MWRYVAKVGTVDIFFVPIGQRLIAESLGGVIFDELSSRNEEVAGTFLNCQDGGPPKVPSTTICSSNLASILLFPFSPAALSLESA